MKDYITKVRPKMRRRAAAYRKRKRTSAPKTIVIRNRHNQPIPDSMSDTFVFDYQGVYSLSAFAQTTMALAGNYIVTGSGTGPFVAGTSTQRFTNAAYFTLAGSGLTAASIPAGFQSFLPATTGTGGLYQKYWVTGMSYEITVQPTNVNDTMVVCVWQDNPATGTSSTSYATFTETVNGPWSKSKTVWGNNDGRGNTLKGFINYPKILGISKSAYCSDVAYGGSVNGAAITVPTSSAGNLFNTYIGFQTLSGGTTSSSTYVNFVAKLKYHVTFKQPQTSQMLN